MSLLVKIRTVFRIFLLKVSPVAWLSGNAFDSISKVTLRRAELVLRWVTACGQVNHLGM